MDNILDRFKDKSIRNAIATNLLEGNIYTEEELLDLEKLDRGETTTEILRQNYLNKLRRK